MYINTKYLPYTNYCVGQYVIINYLAEVSKSVPLCRIFVLGMMAFSSTCGPAAIICEFLDVQDEEFLVTTDHECPWICIIYKNLQSSYSLYGYYL